MRKGREKRLERRKGKGFERRMRKGIGEKDGNWDWSGGRERFFRECDYGSYHGL